MTSILSAEMVLMTLTYTKKAHLLSSLQHIQVYITGAHIRTDNLTDYYNYVWLTVKKVALSLCVVHIAILASHFKNLEGTYLLSCYNILCFNNTL